MANEEQLELLKSGGEAWNKWRKENSYALIDLSEANLFHADLSNADLSGANLSEADLREANLMEADLSEADLIQVNHNWFTKFAQNTAFRHEFC